MLVLNNGNFLIMIPLPPLHPGGEPMWRVAAGVPDALGVPPHAPPMEYLQGVLDAFGPACIPASVRPTGDKKPAIKQVIWSTRFRLHSAIADTPFKRLGQGSGGPIVLIGDAVSGTFGSLYMALSLNSSL